MKYINKITGQVICEEIYEKLVLENILIEIVNDNIDKSKIKKIYKSSKNNFMKSLLLEFHIDYFEQVNDFELDFDLRRLREFRDIPQSTLANLLSITIPGYRKKEKGISDFKIKEFYLLCEFFKKTESDMKKIIENIKRKI